MFSSQFTAESKMSRRCGNEMNRSGPVGAVWWRKVKSPHPAVLAARTGSDTMQSGHEVWRPSFCSCTLKDNERKHAWMLTDQSVGRESSLMSERQSSSVWFESISALRTTRNISILADYFLSLLTSSPLSHISVEVGNWFVFTSQ